MTSIYFLFMTNFWSTLCLRVNFLLWDRYSRSLSITMSVSEMEISLVRLNCSYQSCSRGKGWLDHQRTQSETFVSHPRYFQEWVCLRFMSEALNPRLNETYFMFVGHLCGTEWTTSCQLKYHHLYEWKKKTHRSNLTSLCRRHGNVKVSKVITRGRMQSAADKVSATLACQ